MTQVDYIIVGQGLAGSLICSHLMNRGSSFIVFDQGHQGSSSICAAGIINPVTGRRFVKSWLYDTLIDQALKQYHELEKLLAVTLIKKRNIVRQLPDWQSQNDWLAKIHSPGYEKYILPEADLSSFGDKLYLEGQWAEVTGHQVDIPLLISTMRQLLLKKERLIQERFQYDHCRMTLDNVIYQDFVANHIVFCEGAQLGTNTLFNPERYFNPSKGEVLKIRIDDFQPDKMIKKKYFLVHLTDDIFWFGAKDGWNFENSEPSAEGSELLNIFARKLIKVPFEVINHQAAIRPPIKDRRPVIGKDAAHERAWIFNGLGTKGASLGPYWSDTLISHIEDGAVLSDLISPERFH